MRTPRLYRIALRAYPTAYRAARGAELAATLADGDAERGRPSKREALALVGRGLAMRVRSATAPAGLLVAAAVLMLLAVVGGFDWADTAYLSYGPGLIVAFGDGPSWALQVALGVGAYMAIVAGPFGAAESRPRRLAAAWFAAPVAIVILLTPGRLFQHGPPDGGAVGEFLRWAPAVVADWPVTAPACAGAMLATWLGLSALGRLGQRHRERLLAGFLAVLGAVVVARIWLLPNLPDEYGNRSVGDLGTAALLTAGAVLVAVVTLWRAWRIAPRGR
ncbi:MAG TPA: hypothetical protein VGF25_21905 [Thermoleophilaceae bacterium]